jgi:hypothetical protein
MAIRYGVRTMRPISRLRFNALAGYARQPQTFLFAEELGWFEHASERVLGVLIRDRTDNDYAGMVMARDELLQYRWTASTGFEPTERRARALLRPALEQAAMAPNEEHYQGHGRKISVDFFTPVVATERLNRDFRNLVEQESYTPARGIIEPMMRWYQDVDGNFIEQFQTTGFDARLWELYLFATLTELGFVMDRSERAPDFVASSLFGTLAIEAVTVNPTQDETGAIVAPPPLDTQEQLQEFLINYMPIKFGSALYSKLIKEYWTKPHVRGKPLVLAVQDFLVPGSMTFTRPALSLYLYGYTHDWTRDDSGRLIVTPRRVASHRWGAKEVPSGFFFLPGAENISAVLWNNSGTISKFNRMGALAGFGSHRVRMIRKGTALNPDPNASSPLAFQHVVGAPGYHESWVEGCEVFHNPLAAVPLDPALLPGAAHLRLRDDGQLVPMVMPDWHPLGSWTLIGTPAEPIAIPGADAASGDPG